MEGVCIYTLCRRLLLPSAKEDPGVLHSYDACVGNASTSHSVIEVEQTDSTLRLRYISFISGEQSHDKMKALVCVTLRCVHAKYDNVT